MGWSVKWSLATAFFVAVMIVSAYFVFNEAVKGGGYISVPDVVGLPITQAQLVLAEAGLAVGQQKQVVHMRIPEYHVALQRPAANKVVRSGRKINITISAGKRREIVPRLIGQELEAALQALEGTRLVAGTIARMSHDSARDLVLAQDPGPAQDVSTGTEVSLLVSDGPAMQTLFMPNLVGKPIEAAIELLADLGVDATPYKVERPGAYNVVLDQNPQPGTRISDDTPVTFDVRLTPGGSLANARRRVSYTYAVPLSAASAEVRVDVVDRNGNRKTVFPLPVHYVDGRPPRLAGGSTLSDTVSFSEECTIEFYVDGDIERSYYYEHDAAPVVSVFSMEDVEPAAAPSERLGRSGLGGRTPSFN